VRPFAVRLPAPRGQATGCEEITGELIGEKGTAAELDYVRFAPLTRNGSASLMVRWEESQAWTIRTARMTR